MGRHSIFIDWKIQHNKDAKSPQIDLQSILCTINFNAIFVKIPAIIYIDIDNLILKWIAKTVFKEKKCGRNHFPTLRLVIWL